MYSLLSRKLSSVQFNVLALASLFNSVLYMYLGAALAINGYKFYSVFAVIGVVACALFSVLFMSYANRKAVSPFN